MKLSASQLRELARQRMIEHGFRVDFPGAVQEELARLTAAPAPQPLVRDLTGWLWSSIDNDDTRDMDQIEFAKAEGDATRVWVAIADVSVYVAQGSAIDEAAGHNTTSVYTGVATFPMLPEALSTDRSSLVENETRRAVVIEFTVSASGEPALVDVYPGLVRNKARLTYSAVGAWLEESRGEPSSRRTQAGTTTSPDQGHVGATSLASRPILERIRGDRALQEQLALQHRAAQALRDRRHAQGALSLQTQELQVQWEDDQIVGWRLRTPDFATRLIEDFMVAANQSVDLYLQGHQMAVLQRVVRRPKRWDRIVQLGESFGAHLPPEPDSPALEAFVVERRQKSPETFGDLSLAIVKLLGRGEYVVQTPGVPGLGHFGLALAHYSHSTAPNRRYPDLLTQRLLWSCFLRQSAAYRPLDLDALARHCTLMEDEANKVERSVRKSMAAQALADRLGQSFEGLITGASEKGVWVRLRHPPIEGRVYGNTRGLDVGDPVRVRLSRTDPSKGFIDFERL
jgi:exoribonuclease R